MSIIVSEPVSERGRKDARRHREKQREALKDRLPEIISDEAIITHNRGKTIKIPIRSIDIPHFRPDRGEGGGRQGFGQGDGQPGDPIAERPGKGRPGEAGEEPGEDYIETEVSIEEIIELMLEDIGLPNLEEKEVKELIVEIGIKIAGLQKSGPWSLLDRRATAREGMRRFWYFFEALKKETGLDELTCFRALKQATGILGDAIEILKNNQLTLLDTKVEPFPIFTNEDLRYRKIGEETEKQSNAVLIVMMDVSGSMDDMKKYLSRSMMFWLVEFLRKVYSQVVVRFIVHHTIAKIVSEEDFFKTGENGGTFCYVAYEMANSLVETEYPTDSWNVYVWHFSDGDDSKPKRTVEELEKLIKTGVNMIGYGEVKPSTSMTGFMFNQTESSLWKLFQNSFALKEAPDNDIVMMTGEKETPLLCVRIQDRSHILPALKEFLRKDRWLQ